MRDLYEKIHLRGGRVTKIRKQILEIISSQHCLLSLAKIGQGLAKNGMKPDRSTIFREMQFLVSNNIILKNTISGVDYYERQHDHHHHLVCLKCKAIKKIKIDNHLAKQEKQIAKKNKFVITNHSLEFYGYCCKCKKLLIN